MPPFTWNQQQQLMQLVRQSGQQAEQMASAGFEVFEKGTNDFVTTVDRTLDQALSAGLSRLFPGDRIITEENPASWRQFDQVGQLDQPNSGDRRFWCIDPLDGTSDFIQRRRHYAVMVGLLQDGIPVGGWIYAPAFDRLYFGGAEWGLFTSDSGNAPYPLRPAALPPPTAACPIVIGDQDRKRYGPAILQAIPSAQFSNFGSFGLKVMQVIAGQAGLYLYFNQRVKVWDTVAPLALAQAAGLVCCDLAGRPLSFAPEALHLATLAHRQPILIGWSSYIEALRSTLAQVFATNAVTSGRQI